MHFNTLHTVSTNVPIDLTRQNTNNTSNEINLNETAK